LALRHRRVLNVLDILKTPGARDPRRPRTDPRTGALARTAGPPDRRTAGSPVARIAGEETPPPLR
ncbi:hypothetical protein ACFUJR_28585, partial [Streptomyces sp. NPDC057271]|uniref:hypothetical protein n=1 Tax=Streptomyces sp. NPDC057271 TaxID=3346078 RepID=UPI003638389E